MKFADTGLPKHSEIETAFEAMNAFYGNDANEFFKGSLEQAKFLAGNMTTLDPGLVGAALIQPALLFYGAKFSDKLEGSSALGYAEAYGALGDKTENGVPDFAAPENKPYAMLLLASMAHDVNKILQQNSYASDPAYGEIYRSAQDNQNKRELLPEVQSYKTFTASFLPLLEASEPKLVKAFSDIVAGAEKTLSTPWVKPAQPKAAAAATP